MFGYIVPERKELKVKDDELFRAYYCGVCKTISKQNGLFPRFALNYDIVFLAIFLSSLDEKKSTIERDRCISHPFKKRKHVIDDKALEYTANIGTILAYFNLIDDWTDEENIKSLLASILLKSGSRKAKKRFEEKYYKIQKLLRNLEELEKNNEIILDKVADSFAKIMEEICNYDGIEDEMKKTALKWLGYHTGRWIYILDAYDDLEDDYKENSYNPLISGLMDNKEDILVFKERIKSRIEYTLISSLSEISKSYELLDIKKNNGIIDNIIFLGMRKKMDSILSITSEDSIK